MSNANQNRRKNDDNRKDNSGPQTIREQLTLAFWTLLITAALVKYLAL